MTGLFGDDFIEDPDEEDFESIKQSDQNIAPGGLVHPRLMEISIGHSEIEKNLLAMINAGKIPHSLIFSGPKGIGKATLAYRLARYLFKNGAADPNQNSLFGDAPAAAISLAVKPDDPIFRRIASGAHPDMMNVERQYDDAKNRYKTNVDVNEIRKVAPFLRMTASEGGWRVVLIDDADTMNRNAQNALLKILEEPPKNTVLILIAHSLGTLIPTIRSRSRTIHFNPLKSDDMCTLLARHTQTLDKTRMDMLLQLSNGSIGQALSLVDEQGLETLERVINSLHTYPAWNWAELHILAEELGRAGQDKPYLAFETMLQWVFAQMTKAKARGQELDKTTPILETIDGIMRNSSLEQLLKICENLQGHFEKVEASNLDKRQGVLGAFSLIAA